MPRPLDYESRTDLQRRDLRHLSDLSHDRVAELLDRVRVWLGAAWLPRNLNNPLSALWFRNDWLAVAELVSLGIQLERVEALANSSSFLLEVQRHVRVGTPENRTGHLWELASASMFNDPRHPVELAKRGQPGFDFTLRSQVGPHVRFSCKALTPSIHELAFREFAVELIGSVGHIVAPKSAVQLYVARQRTPEGALDVNFCLHTIENLLARSDGLYRAGGWFFVKRKLLHNSYPLSPHEASYSVTLASEHTVDEQRRFQDCIQRALANLTKHCASLPPNTTNAVLMKVPAPISIENAAHFATECFRPEHSHVAGVFLYRAQVLFHHPSANGKRGKSKGLYGAYISHEYKQVPNPGAAVQFPDLHLQVPVGLFSFGEPKNTLFVGAKEVPLRNMYLLSGGKLVYASSAVKGNGLTEEYRFPLHAAHTESLVVIVKRPDGGQIRIDSPAPEPWLALL